MQDFTQDLTAVRQALQTFSNPRVLHFNDCAQVGYNLCLTAKKLGYEWDYLPPNLVRPSQVKTRLSYLPYVLRRAKHVAQAQIVHVHYATSARLLRERFIASRPYFLHLHGTDIRKQFFDPKYRDEVKRAIAEAQGVFYTNLDTIEQAFEARADAVYMPAFVNFEVLPPWRPSGQTGKSRIVFTSRFDDDKGVKSQLELIKLLHQALPQVELVGLNWGPQAGLAQKAGVRLVEKLSHQKYLELLASADLAIGQANTIFAVSEFEAMAIGVPVAALKKRVPRPDDASVPPALEGSPSQIVEQVVQGLSDPRGLSKALGGEKWVREHHSAIPYIPVLANVYDKCLKSFPGR